MGSFYTKYIRFELKKYIGAIFHDTEHKAYNFSARKLQRIKCGLMTLKGDAKLKQKTDLWLNFHVSSQKSKNLHFDRLLLSKAYKVLDAKVQKSCVS